MHPRALWQRQRRGLARRAVRRALVRQARLTGTAGTAGTAHAAPRARRRQAQAGRRPPRRLVRLQ